MANCCRATREPRIPGGESSELYYETEVELSIANDIAQRDMYTHHGHQHGKGSDSQTSNESTGPEKVNIVLGSNLKSGSEHENETPARNGKLSRKLVRQGSCNDGSYQSSVKMIHKKETILA